MAARVSLDDKYALDRGCVLISGTQEARFTSAQWMPSPRRCRP
jgi:hypothetical protein